MQEYLKENYSSIDLEDESEFKDLAIMDSDKFDETSAQCSKELQEDIEKKEDIYRKYLGEKFTSFNLVNFNVLNRI